MGRLVRHPQPWRLPRGHEQQRLARCNVDAFPAHSRRKLRSVDAAERRAVSVGGAVQSRGFGLPAGHFRLAPQCVLTDSELLPHALVQIVRTFEHGKKIPDRDTHRSPLGRCKVLSLNQPVGHRFDAHRRNRVSRALPEDVPAKHIGLPDARRHLEPRGAPNVVPKDGAPRRDGLTQLSYAFVEMGTLKQNSLRKSVPVNCDCIRAPETRALPSSGSPGAQSPRSSIGYPLSQGEKS